VNNKSRVLLGCTAWVFAWLVCAPHAGDGARTVAVTFDDLPATASAAMDVGQLQQLTQKLIASLRKYRIPAVGFVNEGKLFVGPEPDVDGRTRLLELWLEAGVELGNHTYSHRDLNRVPLEDFQADVIRGEVVTRRLMEANGRQLRYFRHPFLHVGEDLPKRRAFKAFLTGRGYIVAPVTIDTDEYVFAAAYEVALRRRDAATATRIAEEYVRYIERVCAFFEDVSLRVTGREIPQVLLLHANALNADHVAGVAELLARRGYRFVPLEEALRDPAYRLPDEFVGAPGNSWFNHWEVTAGRASVATPAPPAWVTTFSQQ
jgi:peptidoglycan/xylan/chitin deacetylase (PgdA/CDA1 family)